MREVHDGGTVHPRGVIMRSMIRNVAATTATVLGFVLTATVFALMAPPAARPGRSTAWSSLNPHGEPATSRCG
jgi:hypothetical protein